MKFRQALFWDTNPRKIEVKKNAPYIIERVLEYGRDNEVRWLWETYDKSSLKKALVRSRGLRPSTRSLWSLLLKIAHQDGHRARLLDS
jgi:hypothetical protein